MAACVAVPLRGPRRRAARRPRRLIAPRDLAREEVQALAALGVVASAALSNAELYQRVARGEGGVDAILANIADGIVAVDRDGTIVLWNATAEQITGVPAAEALGRTPVQVLQRDLEAAARRRRPARLDPARRQGGLALGHRGGHARPGRRRRRPHLRLPRRLRASAWSSR